MTEKEVLDILAKFLMKRQTAEALALAYKEIGLQLLSELKGTLPNLDEETWLTLQMINDTKSRLCFYNGLNQIESSDADASTDYILGYLNICEFLEKILIFLYQRYESLNFSDDLAKSWPKEVIPELLEAIKNKRVAYLDQLGKEGRIQLNIAEPRTLDGICNTAYNAILGEAWPDFMAKFNQANAILRKYQGEIQLPQQDNVQ